MVINIKGSPKNIGLVHHDDILDLSDRILPPILICLYFPYLVPKMGNIKTHRKLDLQICDDLFPKMKTDSSKSINVKRLSTFQM